jgi:glycosyltransferase involved in cell wall biosynthesis
MRLLFVADGRSPIALNWIRYFVERGDEVCLVSTFACDVHLNLKRLDFVPVAFSSTRRQSLKPDFASSRSLILRTAVRQWLGPLTISTASRRLRKLIREIQPDLVHAMRIPFEGMLASCAVNGVPLVISVWGNDFTLHAPSTPLMKRFTRRALKSVDGLHTDCARDVRLAGEWGFYNRKPTLLIPGNGGIRTEIFYPSPEPAAQPVVFNPRGFRAYVRNDSFFKAIPQVLSSRPKTRFVCASMAGNKQAIAWINELHLESEVDLLALLPHEKMAGVFRAAQVLVSPSVHDGTPNSLLEGMACGCFPVAGDLESIREWITPGRNGLLVDVNDPGSLADAIVTALDRPDLRTEAASLNQRLISSRAEYGQCMSRAFEFYKSII